MTIAIVYNGGAYGTYLEWVLTTLTTNIPIVAPFRPNGSSHQFHGNHAGDMHASTWRAVVNKKKSVLFVRLHPKTQQHEVLGDNLNKILDVAEKVIYLYPDPNSVLLTINNFYSKIDPRWWDMRPLDPMFVLLRSTQTEPVWRKREILSFNLMPVWYDQMEWYYPARHAIKPCKVVPLSKLLYRFENTILKIQKFCNLEFKKSIDDMIPYHSTMLSLQKWSTQDQLCNNIINSILSDQLFDWGDQILPLPSQSWLQWELRNRGFEIQCNGLDKFPTNSVQLKELLYPV
jgi:hypothetical protein